MPLPKTLSLVLTLALGSTTPVFAQSATPMQSTNHQASGDIRKVCREQWRSEHMPALHEQMKAHMEQFRAANPSASMEQLRAERQSFVETLRAQYKPQAEAQVRSCVEASHAEGATTTSG
jgi:hypothetical protein